MKNNKNLRILIDLILIILGIIFLVFGIKDAIDMFKTTKVDDATLFKQDYSSVPKDNVYRYLTIKEIDEMLSTGTGMILISNPESSWTQVLVEPLNSIAINKEIDIYYLENKNLDESSKHYVNILSKTNLDALSNPMLIFVKEGKINSHYLREDIYDVDYDGAPIDYWTEELKQNLSDTILKEIDLLK